MIKINLRTISLWFTRVRLSKKNSRSYWYFWYQQYGLLLQSYSRIMIICRNQYIYHSTTIPPTGSPVELSKPAQWKPQITRSLLFRWNLGKPARFHNAFHMFSLVFNFNILFFQRTSRGFAGVLTRFKAKHMGNPSRPCCVCEKLHPPVTTGWNIGSPTK